MKFLCGSCKTKYQISEEKVRGKVLTIRCQKCGSKVRVREPAKALTTGEAFLAEVIEEAATSAGSTVKHRAVAANAGSRVPTSDLGVADFDDQEEAPTRIAVGVATPAPAPPDPNTSVEWFTATDGKQQGPFTYAELLRRIGAREVGPSHYVWNQSMGPWTRVRELPELAKLVPPEPAKKKSTSPPPLPAPRPTSEERALGEVVDLAERRAELERTKKVDLHSTPRLKSLIDTPQVASQTPASLEEDTVQERATPKPKIKSSPKAEKTPVSAPLEAIALHTTTPVAGGSAANLDLAADLFAGLPRMQTEEQPLRESTRFFIAAAGVHREKSRNMLGLVLSLVGVVAFGAFITAWASGFVTIPLPANVNPFKSTPAQEPVAAIDDDTDPEDEAKARALGGKSGKKRRARPAAGQPVSERTADGSDGPRGGDVSSATIKFDPTGGSKLVGDVPEAKLPESDLTDMVAPDKKELSHDALHQVVRQKSASVRDCYEGALRSGSGLSGKMTFELTVKPSGDVAQVKLLGKDQRGVGSCISERIKSWKFPAFEGSEHAVIEANFVLTNSM